MLEYLGMLGRDVDYAARSDALSAKSSAIDSAAKVDEISYRIGAIELAVETMVRLGVDQNLFTEQQFLALARQIDAEDGIIDGRRDLSKLRKLCQKCGKPNGGAKQRCLWCGGSLSQARPIPHSEL